MFTLSYGLSSVCRLIFACRLFEFRRLIFSPTFEGCQKSCRTSVTKRNNSQSLCIFCQFCVWKKRWEKVAWASSVTFFSVQINQFLLPRWKRSTMEPVSKKWTASWWPLTTTTIQEESFKWSMNVGEKAVKSMLDSSGITLMENGCSLDFKIIYILWHRSWNFFETVGHPQIATHLNWFLFMLFFGGRAVYGVLHSLFPLK